MRVAPILTLLNCTAPTCPGQIYRRPIYLHVDWTTTPILPGQMYAGPCFMVATWSENESKGKLPGETTSAPLLSPRRQIGTLNSILK